MARLQIRDESGAEQEVVLDPLPFKIGKKAGVNHLVLKRPNISREHCMILERDGMFLLRDLRSRNGTFLNGTRLDGQAPLLSGSVIRVGPLTMTFADDADAGTPPTPRPAAEPTPSEDGLLRTPVALKQKIHDEIIATLDLKHTDFSEKSPEEVRAKTAEAARAASARFQSEIPAWLATDRLVKEVVDEAVGLGMLEDLLEDETVDEIMVNGWNRVYVERRGRIELVPKQFTSNEQVVSVIRRILAPIGRRIDESSPMVDARLPDGSRVNAVIAPLSLTGPTVTIRKFAKVPFTGEDLIGFGSIGRDMLAFLELAVKYRRNICISGGTGSGKTTLLNVLSGFIPGTERIVTIEDAAELQLKQEHVVSLEAKPASIEGKGAIPIRKLVINSLRMRPDRIIVGECRGGEALDMLQAMNTGHDGSLTTLHANSPRDALSRLETMVLMAGLDLPVRAIRDQVASAINIIVHGGRLVDGTRKVTDICEITGMGDDKITMQTIFEFKQAGFDGEGRVVGELRATGAVPKFVHELQERKIPVPLELFKTPEGPQ